jgi:hypothetical protein
VTSRCDSILLRDLGENILKNSIFLRYVAFLRGTQKSGVFSLAESLFPVGPVLWKAIWESD